jgi:P27 family predicted phage terminase small subunit
METAVPDAPEWIKRNVRAHDRWRALWPILDRSRIKPELHSDYVCQYCVAYADIRDAQEKMDQMGKLVKDKQGRVTVNPYQVLYDAAVNKMAALGDMLGIRPDRPLEPHADARSDAEILRISFYSDAAE